MKRKILKFCTLLTAVLLMAVTLAACGGSGDNPFLGAWDDDESEQSFIFNEDGTGVQASYSGAIDSPIPGTAIRLRSPMRKGASAPR